MPGVIDWLLKAGFVLWPLMAFSIVSLALMLERSWFWWKITHRQEQVVRDCLSLYQRNPRAALFKLEQNADLPIARIFLSALELDDASPEDFRLALETSASAEIPLLKRFTTVFDTVVTLSPFFGLLGTVTGIIALLNSLRIGETAGPGAQGVESGIAEALHSTALGLFIAIPVLLVSNVFRSLYLRQISKIQEYGGQLELLHRQRLEQHPHEATSYADPRRDY